MPAVTKIIAACVIILAGFALASLFPKGTNNHDGRAVASRDGDSLTEVSRLDLNTEKEKDDPHVRSHPVAHNMAPKTTLQLPGGSTSNQLRQPPPMPTEYAALVRPQQRDNVTLHENEQPQRAAVVLRPNRDEHPPRPIFHRIQDGDTLASIARRYLGDEQLADRVIAANNGKITNPNWLPIGVELVIPRHDPTPPTANVADAAANGAETRLVPISPQ